MQSESDFIVIGAGSAGCAAAYELAKSGRSSVTLLEAGGHDRSPYIKVPAFVVQACKRFDWSYESQPDHSRGGKLDWWTRGRVLGGTSSINGMMFVRGAAQDYDRWAAAGNSGWAYADVLPLLKELECSDQTGPLRGREGRVHVRTVRRAHPLSAAFVQAAVGRGYPFNADYNGERQDGVSYAQLSQKKGLRFSAADAFVRPLKRMPNFKMRLNTLATKIVIADGRATGVRFIESGREGFLAARRVLVCAGAVNSPKLLLLSGIGDPAELSRVGIKPLIESPEVGRNLREHPLLRFVYGTRVESNNLTGGALQRLRILSKFLLRREGPISTLFEAAAFLKTNAALSHPDVQLHFMPFGVLGIGSRHPRLDVPAITIYLNKSHPKSAGAIRLATPDPLSPPLIEGNLLSEDADVATLVAGIDLVRGLASTAPLRDLITEEIAPRSTVRSAQDMENYVRDHSEIAYHPIGTCRMGPDSAAVVGPDLRVNGTENIWVADASVMPDHVSGNTNAACMMIGMKAARALARC